MPVLGCDCGPGLSLVSAVEPGGRPNRVNGLSVGLFNAEVSVQFSDNV